MRIGVLIVSCLLLPIGVEGAVTISEIAWMGSATSANDEWIELFNDGSAQSVEGWTLSDGNNLNITLVGTITAGQRAVLERTDDDSAPGAAFMIYAGSLTNAGATLTLRDQNNTLVDQVAGGENWLSIGGDNVTKETAQLTVGGWVTGAPTPGRANVTTGTVVPEEVPEEETTVSTASNSNSEPTVSLQLPDHTLTLTLDMPTQVYVNQTVPMAVETSGLDRLEASLAYDWNFGDIETATGKTVEHTYHYPGRYLVVVDAYYARHTAKIRQEITVLPVNFSITRNQAGDVQIHNDAKYEINISGYRIQGLEGMTLPPETYLLPGATLTVPAEMVGDTDASMIALLDAQTTAVAWHNRQSAPPTISDQEQITVAAAPPAAVLGAISPPVGVTDTFSFSPAPTQVIASTATATVVSKELVSTSSALTAAASQQPLLPSNSLPYLGLIGVLSLGFLTIVASRTKVANAVS